MSTAVLLYLRPLGSSLEEQKDGVSIKPLSDVKARFAFNFLNLSEDRGAGVWTQWSL